MFEQNRYIITYCINHASKVEGSSHVLMRFLLFLEMFLEFVYSTLQVAVDLDVARDNALHATNVFVDVVLDGPDALDI